MPWPVSACAAPPFLAIISFHFLQNHDRQAETVSINKENKNTKKKKIKKQNDIQKQNVGSLHVSSYLDLYSGAILVSYANSKKVLVSGYFCQTLASLLGSWVDWREHPATF